MLYLKPLWAWINDQHWWTKSTHGGVTLPPPSTSAFTVELLLDGFKGCWIIFSSGLQLLFLCFHAGSLCPSHGKLGVQMCQPYITGPPRRKIDLLLSDLRSKLGIQHWNLLVCSTKQGVLLPQTKSGTCRFVDQMGPNNCSNTRINNIKQLKLQLPQMLPRRSLKCHSISKIFGDLIDYLLLAGWDALNI